MKKWTSCSGGADLRLLLDTVTFIRAVQSPDRLTARARKLLQDEESVLEISAISLSEIAIKNTLGKLSFTSRDVFGGMENLDARALPWTARHAAEMFDLPLHHSDPFDRQIIAQAIVEGIPIVTPDEAFRLYKGIKVIW